MSRAGISEFEHLAATTAQVTRRVVLGFHMSTQIASVLAGKATTFAHMHSIFGIFTKIRTYPIIQLLVIATCKYVILFIFSIQLQSIHTFSHETDKISWFETIYRKIDICIQASNA